MGNPKLYHECFLWGFISLSVLLPILSLISKYRKSRRDGKSVTWLGIAALFLLQTVGNIRRLDLRGCLTPFPLRGGYGSLPIHFIHGV